MLKHQTPVVQKTNGAGIHTWGAARMHMTREKRGKVQSLLLLLLKLRSSLLTFVATKHLTLYNYCDAQFFLQPVLGCGY